MLATLTNRRREDKTREEVNPNMKKHLKNVSVQKANLLTDLFDELSRILDDLIGWLSK